ncbi:MAG TPA: winged helix-turn-helix domain-containing protein [Thermoanaerobaculia bacterium]
MARLQRPARPPSSVLSWCTAVGVGLLTAIPVRADATPPVGDETLVRRDDFLRQALSAPLRFLPGEDEGYSNAGYSVLAVAFESLSGGSYERYLRLEKLARRPGAVVSRDELHESVWQDAFVTDDALNRCIQQLRKVLGDDAREPRFIETISKRGYRLIAAVERLHGAVPGNDIEPRRADQLRPRGTDLLGQWGTLRLRCESKRTPEDMLARLDAGMERTRRGNRRTLWWEGQRLLLSLPGAASAGDGERILIGVRTLSLSAAALAKVAGEVGPESREV